MQRTQQRYLFDPVVNAGKMIFLFGPRQIGKTTFAVNRLKETGDEALYYNWDDPQVKREYTRNPHFLKAALAHSKNPIPLVVFDEIHKHRQWKNIVKGLYDIHRDEAQFMITGSARLDFFRASGDSLVGRYFSYRMLPLGVPEAAGQLDGPLTECDLLGAPAKHQLLFRLAKLNGTKLHTAFTRLLTFGGYPEPFTRANPAFSLKWRRDYQSLLIHEDLRDLSRIQDIKGIEQLLLLLPERVGTPLSVNSIREDLQVNHRTVANWIEALKKIHLVFTITPWTEHVAQAIIKEPKLYFFDWTMVQDGGTRFENMVAVMLLRMISRWNELGVGDFDLRFVRNKQKAEVDFLVVKDRQPYMLVEAKTGETDIPRSSHQMAQALKVPYYQLLSDKDIMEEHADQRYVLSAWSFLLLVG